MSYADQRTWREIQSFLPAEYRMPAGLDQMVDAIADFCADVSS